MGRVGRPRKVFTEDDAPVTTSIKLKNRTIKMLPSGFNLTQFVENAVNALLQDKEKYTIQQLEKKLQELEIEAAQLKLKINSLKEQEKLNEAMRKALRVEERKPTAAFRLMMNSMLKAHPKMASITTTEDAIIETYGITFDRDRINKEFDEFKLDFLEGLVSDEILVKKYKLMMVEPHPSRLKDIVGMIEKEVGLA